MKTHYKIFAALFLIGANIYTFSVLAELIRTASDIAVLCGFVLLLVTAFVDYHIIKYILNHKPKSHEKT